jgi:hypothetical protein
MAQGRQLAHSAVSVGTSDASLVAANPDRTYLLIQNDSSNTVWIKAGAAAAANEGIRLGANGGSFTMSLAERNIDSREIRAIAGGADSNVLVTEA